MEGAAALASSVESAPEIGLVEEHGGLAFWLFEVTAIHILSERTSARGHVASFEKRFM